MHLQGVVLMLNNPTVEKLKDMKLKVMAQMFADPDNGIPYFIDVTRLKGVGELSLSVN